MDVYSGTFKSHDGLNLFYRFGKAENAQRTLIILHGHGEHSGRYEKFYERLKNLPISIAVFDTRGNGRSEGRPVFVNSFEDYLSDVDAFIQCLSDKHQVSGKMIVLGHSLGGLIALYWAFQHSDRVLGVVLSSPCLGLNLPPWVIYLNQCIKKWLPRFYYSHPIYPPHLSHNQEEIQKYRQDPLIQRKMSPQLLDIMVQMTKQLETRPRIPVDFPVFLMVSELEKVVNLSATLSVYERLDAPRKKIEIFKGLYHEIFNEIEQDRVFLVLENYLRDILDHSH